MIQDALVKCNVLEDDGWNYVTGFTDEFFHDKDNPRIEVTLIETETGGGDCRRTAS